MKTFITTSNTSTTGYQLVIRDEGQEDRILPIQEWDKLYPDSLKLPENPSNRKYFNIKKLKDEETELTYKPTMTFGPRTETSTRKPLEDYLSPEDKELYLSLIEKAKKNKEEQQKKPMTEREKIEARIMRLQEKLNNLN